MIYFDGVHLIADTPGELHKYAQQLGLKRKWFQPKRYPHYDVFGAPALRVERDINRGRVEGVTARELVAKAKAIKEASNGQG